MKAFDEETRRRVYELYANNVGTVKISKLIHTSPSKVKDILIGFGVDIHDPNKPVGKAVKPNGYWRDKECNEKAASECRNRREFSKKYICAYKIAKELGWILEYDKKYFNGSKKFVSFDDMVHKIYSYELSDKHAVYVGRTIDLTRRDLCHRNKTQNDSLYRYCLENNTPIPEIKIIEDGLTAIQSQEREDYWKNKYAEDGWIIINKAPTGIGSGSLGSMPRKWTYETCMCAAERCASKEDFKKKYVGAHNVSRKNGWINDFFPCNMKRANGCFDTLEKCKEVAINYNDVMDIRKRYPFLYHKISKNGWTSEIKAYLLEHKKTQG